MQSLWAMVHGNGMPAMTWTSFLMSWPACSVRTAISIRPMMMSETQAMATTAPMSILIMTSQAHLVFMSTMSVAVELTQSRTSSRLFPSRDPDLVHTARRLQQSHHQTPQASTTRTRTAQSLSAFATTGSVTLTFLWGMVGVVQD